MQPQPAIFEEHEIRRVYDEATETWWFSVVDIVQVLTQQPDYQTAQKVLEQAERAAGQGRQSTGDKLSPVENDRRGRQATPDRCRHRRNACCAWCSPCPARRPSRSSCGWRRWAMSGCRRWPTPPVSLDRARETWQKHGRSEKWIQQRMTGQETRNKLTDYWANHDIKEGEEYAILTNIIHQEWAEVDVKAHKTMKGLKTQNLRDHMSEAELIFTALAELSTRQIAESVEATGMNENEAAAKTGGGIAKKARLELEGKTGRKVVTAENYLPPVKKKLGKK